MNLKSGYETTQDNVHFGEVIEATSVQQSFKMSYLSTLAKYAEPEKPPMA
jgi:hypothetical protein